VALAGGSFLSVVRLSGCVAGDLGDRHGVQTTVELAVALLLLLMRLGLLNFGERSSATVQHWQPNTAVQGSQSASPTSEAPKWQRLRELEALRSSGAISDTEYVEKRERLISSI
jgi:hypothetical protein